MGVPPSAAGGSDRLADGSAGPPWARGLIVVNDQNPQGSLRPTRRDREDGDRICGSKLLTRSNEAEPKAWSEGAYRVAKYLRVAHPTRFERVTFAFGGQTSNR